MRTRTRHLWGLLLGIIGAPVLFALLTGGVALAAAGQGGNAFDTRAAFAALGAAALVTAILAAPRISPIASLLSGLALAGLGSLVAAPGLAAGPRLRANLPATDLTFGHGTALPLNQAAVAALGTGVFALVGALLVLASLAPSRWRGRPQDHAVIDPEVEEESSWRPALPVGPDGTYGDVGDPPSNVSPTTVSPSHDDY